MVAGSATVMPGDEGQSKVSFDTQGHSGQVQATISVTTNDPKHREVVLLLTSTVENSPLHAGTE